MNSTEQNFAETTLRLIAKNGWESLSLEAIAKASKSSVANVKKHFGDKSKIIPFLVTYVTRATIKSVGKVDVSQTPRDRLFEIMMARCDVLQQNRIAFQAIVKALKNDSRTAASLLLAQREAMQSMLHHVGLADHGLRQHITVVGLMGVYAATVWAWHRDETIDMSRTMAALGRALSAANRLADIVFRRVQTDK
jgi:hypothetical protein